MGGMHLVNIRSAESEDKERLIEFVISMVGDSNSVEVAKNVVDDFFENKKMNTFMLEKEEKIIGFSVFKEDPFEGADNVAEIVWLKIDKPFQRKGYGNKAVEYLEKFSSKKDIRKIYVKTSSENKQAVCFWIKEGYKFETRLLDFSFEGRDDYYLSKKI
jgi:ribosomal protein S18 acetylase RimI-like enzyme